MHIDAWSAAYRGCTRAWRCGVEVFVDRALGNARKLREALVDFGFGAAAPTARDLARPDKICATSRCSRNTAAPACDRPARTAALPAAPATSDEALRLALKLAVDAGEYDHAAAILGVLRRTVRRVAHG